MENKYIAPKAEITSFMPEDPIGASNLTSMQSKTFSKSEYDVSWTTKNN